MGCDLEESVNGIMCRTAHWSHELFRLEWKDVDLAHGMLRMPVPRKTIWKVVGTFPSVATYSEFCKHGGGMIRR